MHINAHPILSCATATEYERAFFKDGAITENTMMFRAGRAIAAAIEDDFEEISGFPAQGKALVLAGKGHNTGDAFICANALLDRHPDLEVKVLLAFPVDELRPNVRGPYELLRVRSQATVLSPEDNIPEMISEFSDGRCIDLCVDGVFGMQCRPPLRGIPLEMISAVNQFPNIRLRAAIDLPSGIADSFDENAFHADFTYATGITKSSVTENRAIAKAGRLRYLDLGFFHPCPEIESDEQILLADGLWQLSSFRRPDTHKRTYGHLLILAGSDDMPGACLMSATAAVNSGCGLVTVGTVDSVAAAGIASLPEVMWNSISSQEGTLDDRILEQVGARIDDFSAILIGPGLGRTPHAKALLRRVVAEIDKPIIIDADGLVAGLTEILAKRPKSFCPVVVTPHAGEWKRIGGAPFEKNGAKELNNYCRKNRCFIVLKGARTRVSGENKVFLSPFGGPVLARGGTGDMLSGMVASLVAQTPSTLLASTALATIWHGKTADCLARAQGDTAARTTHLLHYLPEALGFRH